MKSPTTYIPNIITGLNLLSGCIAIFFAFNPDIEIGSLTAMSWAFIFIGIAALFDFCDGFSARLLHAYSPIGKELDSLSDLVSFGLAPAFLVMNLMLANGAPIWLGGFALLIAIAGAFRLAKFNVDTRQATSFIGLPIPANAIFWIGAVEWMTAFTYPGHIVVCLLIAAFSFLMVSELPMFSLKFTNLSVRDNFRRYVLIVATVMFVATVGLSGLAWTIVFYIIISVFGRKQPTATEE